MLKNIAPKPRAGAVTQSRRLRRTMSLPEILLWRDLRARPAGLKFRRQHPSGPYTLDFFCSDARLAIEVDGEAHEWGDRPERDETRDAWFARAGVKTMRIPAIEVLHDLEAVLRGILAEATARLPLHHPAAPDGPPPRAKLKEDEDRKNSSPSSLGEGDRDAKRRGGGAIPRTPKVNAPPTESPSKRL